MNRKQRDKKRRARTHKPKHVNQAAAKPLAAGPKPTKRSAMGKFDAVDVAAGVSALLLRPENAAQTDMLVGVTARALSAPATPNRARDIPHRCWKRWVREPSPDFSVPWDEPDDVWARPITFFGGDYLIPTGGESGRTFELDCVLHALFQEQWPTAANRFRQVAHELAMATLRLANAVSAASGLRRYQDITASTGGIVIPEESVMAQAQSSATFSDVELAHLAGAPIADLEPLIHHLEGGPLPGLPGDIARLEATPVTGYDDHYTVAAPHALGIALRHALISAASDASLLPDLASRIADVHTRRIDHAAFFMQWEPVLGWVTESPSIRTRNYRFDTDKVCCVRLVTDDLSSYGQQDPRSEWKTAQRGSSISQGIEQAEQHAVATHPPTNEILHLVVIGGVGRLMTIAMPRNHACFGEVVMLHAEELETITRLGIDQLDLWKFAKASGRLSQTTAVMPRDVVNEFAVWRAHGRSFYLSDGRPPRFLMLESDSGRALRAEAAHLRDLHGAFLPGMGHGLVARLFDDPAIPIYVPWGDFTTVRLLVELPAGDLWIIHEPPASGHAQGSRQLAEAIAYWLWQLDGHLPQLQSLGGSVVIRLDIAQPNPFTVIGLPDTGGTVATVAASGRARLDVVAHPDMAARLNRPDNQAERELMIAILEGLDGLLVHTGGKPLGADRITQAIDAVAPLGVKKHINLSPTNDARLQYLPGVHPRMVQDPDRSDVRDEIGSRVAAGRGLTAGSVPTADRSAVLNDAVGLLSAELAAVVASLDGDGLLAHLIQQHEALLHSAAMSERTAGARLACFSETDLAEEYRLEAPRHGEAATSLRLLIEYVAAKPPTGIRPMSLAAYDHLLALAADITTLGTFSDAAYYGLDDGEISILRSGRLGFDPANRFAAAHAAYRSAISPIRAREVASRYAGYWTRSTAAASPPTYAAELDQAALAEWGRGTLGVPSRRSSSWPTPAR